MKFYKSRCYYCGGQLHKRNWTRDHIIPQSKGGRNDFDNIVEACAPCNVMKADLDLEEFRVVFFGAHIGPFHGEAARTSLSPEPTRPEAGPTRS